LANLSPEMIKSFSAGDLLKELNFSVFGGRKLIADDHEPRHACFFDPGEIWFVDSRKIAHQIFYGRKAISTEHVVETNYMLDQKNHYLNMINAARLDYL